MMMQQDQHYNVADQEWKHKKGSWTFTLFVAVVLLVCSFYSGVTYSSYRRHSGGGTTAESATSLTSMAGNLIRSRGGGGIIGDGDSIGGGGGGDGSDGSIVDDEKIFLSLWLIPPGGDDDDDDDETQSQYNIYDGAQEVIDDLAKKYDGPKFSPHVTIVGGIQVESEDDVQDLKYSLLTGYDSAALSGEWNFAAIDGTFTGIIEEPSPWSQAVAVEMIPSESFLVFCQLSKSLLDIDDGDEDCSTFPSPNGVPHMSLYYGLPPNVPDTSSIDLSRIFGKDEKDKTFQSTYVQLWKTTPSTLEGVPNWELVAGYDIGYK